MTSEAIDALLEKLCSGDADAADRVFRTYEPCLRVVVRRQLSPALRAKFDSLDVVQSVWLHALKRFRDGGYRFVNAAHLRAFLVQLTRHRFIDRLRHHRRTIERERPLGDDVAEAVSAAEPQPLETLQADELWEQLLELCPPAHRQVLRLKREGALTSEVAARTGLNAGSIRRILNALARRLARKRGEDAAGGGRRA